jgi:L-asparaginase II
VVHPEDGCVLASGNPGFVTFLRSAAKPFQAIPLVADGVVDRFGVTPEEIAVCCGSHSGEEVHLRTVRSLLDRVGVTEPALECGPHLPMSESAARGMMRRGEEPRPIHNNCSGKHAGMLAHARHRGWPLEGYRLRRHPVQERALAEISRWTGVPGGRIGLGVDGCGVVCFALPIDAVALGFARLAREAREQPDGDAGRVLSAMAEHPLQVAGSGRLCTELVESTNGRVLAKVGAEGIYCALDRESGLGLALKVEDGARRAAEVALVALLLEAGMVAEGDLPPGWLLREVPNTLGDPVAWLSAEGVVERPGR